MAPALPLHQQGFENWHGKVWRLAGPIILSNLSIPLLGLTDTAVVGRLPGPEYIGAVAVGALIFGILYFGLNFLRMGTTGFVAQAFGAGNVDEVLASLGRAVLLASLLGLGLIILQNPINWAAFNLIQPEQNVTTLATNYFHIRIWGAPAALINFAIVGYFIGIQNTRAALATQVFMNGLNILLDIWFVLGLGWGVDGVAAATLIAEITTIFLGLWLVQKNARLMNSQWRWELVRDLEKIKRMMAVNRDIFIRSICLHIAFVIFTTIGARTGTDILAANALLFQFQHLMSYALDGFAHAAESLAGAAYGAGHKKTFRAAVKASSFWALVFSGAFSLAFWAGGTVLIDFLTTVQSVRDQAYVFLIWAILSPLVSVWSFQLDGIFIGTTHSAEMRNGMIIALLAFILTTVAMVPLYGNHGLWMAFMFFMIVRAIALAFYYPRIEDRLS